MQLLLFILVFIGACAVIIIAAHRKIKSKSDKLLEKLHSFQSYSQLLGKRENFGNLQGANETGSADIKRDLTNSFYGKVISLRELNEFLAHYKQLIQETNSYLNLLKLFKITPNKTIVKFNSHYSNINILVKEHNDKIFDYLLDKHKEYFDNCLTYPLDKQQRRSIISEEDNCLVVSSAGSGKTSSIIGKVKYLTEIKGVAPERILLISYTNKAAVELTDRINTHGLRGYTFHKLAIDIISKTTGIKPSICDNTDSLFIEIYKKLLKKSFFKRSIISFFFNYQIYESEAERKEREIKEYLSKKKKREITAITPDMDGNVIFVKSKQEQMICFALTSFGLKFRYEEPYEHYIADENYSQYCPDFSIYYYQGDKLKRIYLEHYGINSKGLVPQWFAKDKNLTYTEACKKYNDGISWKRETHEKFGTKLLATSSADFDNGDIREKLKKLLIEAGVPISEKTDDELYELVLSKESNQEKAFIRLVSTFITLLKSSCKSIDNVLQEAINKSDVRSIFIIQNIFKPVYESYMQTLRESKQMDFTDVIHQATKICSTSHPVEYDYIIVDEFQDISHDRYQFLKVLREGNPPAKLYCVGDDWQSIYRFSGSDMALFNQFQKYFGATEINKIETTYRFGEPLVSLSSKFIQKNKSQIEKNIHSFDPNIKTELEFVPYNKNNYCKIIEDIISSIPKDKSIFLLGRYSFDDYYLSSMYKSVKKIDKFYYTICGRKIEFLTAHKSKGLEADYVILLQCNKDAYGFPSQVSDDRVLDYVLTKSDEYLFGEERRLFYVAITRAKIKTFILYDKALPSLFVDEFIQPERGSNNSFNKHQNNGKRWTKGSDTFLLELHREGKSIKDIAEIMGRSQRAISLRLEKLNKDMGSI